MDITREQLEEIEAALARMEDLDPAMLPAPAAELAELLNNILGKLDPDQ
jgi:hypothetical protein